MDELAEQGTWGIRLDRWIFGWISTNKMNKCVGWCARAGPWRRAGLLVFVMCMMVVYSILAQNSVVNSDTLATQPFQLDPQSSVTNYSNQDHLDVDSIDELVANPQTILKKPDAPEAATRKASELVPSNRSLPNSSLGQHDPVGEKNYNYSSAKSARMLASKVPLVPEPAEPPAKSRVEPVVEHNDFNVRVSIWNGSLGVYDVTVKGKLTTTKTNDAMPSTAKRRGQTTTKPGLRPEQQTNQLEQKIDVNKSAPRPSNSSSSNRQLAKYSSNLALNDQKFRAIKEKILENQRDHGNSRFRPDNTLSSTSEASHSDDFYVESSMTNLRVDSPDKRTTYVLLVTYARSGSTWLGDITNQAKNTFYVYEPLFRIIVEGYYAKNLVCYNNDTCRLARSTVERHEFALTSIQRLFTCQFSKLHPVVQSNLRRNVQMSAARDVVQLCRLARVTNTHCMSILEKLCHNSEFRVLKTIRLTMDLVEMLLDIIPGLKVIHLVRDPRGITNSRLNGPFRMARSIFHHSRDTCMRMREDIEHKHKLQLEYPGQITTVLYEALAEKPYDGAEFVYKFLKMEVTWPVIHWVFNSTHAQLNSTNYFTTARKDAVESAYRWRTQMSFTQVKIIDRVCAKTYPLVGYLSMETEEIMRDVEFPSREFLKHFDGFL